jgi:hypothetical protein
MPKLTAIVLFLQSCNIPCHPFLDCVDDIYAVAIGNNRFRFFVPFGCEDSVGRIQLADYAIMDNLEVYTALLTFNG